MPQILDPGSVRLSNADVLDWITKKNLEIKSDQAADRAASLPKSHLSANYARSLRKHARELSSHKYPYTDNPGAYLGPNRLKSLAVFAAKVDERIVFPAEEALRARLLSEGKSPEAVDKAVRALWERKQLSETEHLQVFNLAPNAVEMLQNFLLEAEERFEAEELQVLVDTIAEVYRCGESMPEVEGGLEGLEGLGEEDGANGTVGVERTNTATSYTQGPHSTPMVSTTKSSAAVESQNQSKPGKTKGTTSDTADSSDIAALAHIAQHEAARDLKKPKPNAEAKPCSLADQVARQSAEKPSVSITSTSSKSPISHPLTTALADNLQPESAPTAQPLPPSNAETTAPELTKAQQTEQERLASLARFEAEAARIQKDAEEGVRNRHRVGIGGGYSQETMGYVGPKDANATPLGERRRGRKG